VAVFRGGGIFEDDLVERGFRADGCCAVDGDLSGNGSFSRVANISMVCGEDGEGCVVTTHLAF
jgi:hypothetical protein